MNERFPETQRVSAGIVGLVDRPHFIAANRIVRIRINNGVGEYLLFNDVEIFAQWSAKLTSFQVGECAFNGCNKPRRTELNLSPGIGGGARRPNSLQAASALL